MIYLEICKEDGSRQIRELNPGIYSLGSDLENQIVLAGPSVAGRHAILCLRTGGCWVEDLSMGGTRLSGTVVRGRAEVIEGQDIQIDGYRLTLFKNKHEPVIPVAAPAQDTAAPVQKSAPFPPVAPAESGTEAAVKIERGVRDERLLALRKTIKQQILKELMERLDIKRLTAAHIEEGALHQRVLSTLEGIVSEVGSRIPLAISAQDLIKEIYDETVGLGPLEDLLADPSVTEIMVNGPSRVYVERRGKIELTEKTFLDDGSVLAVIERIVSPLGRRIDESQPYVDARLRDGSRVNAVIHPLSLTGPCLTIRKFSKVPLTEKDLIRLGTWTAEMCAFLQAAVLARKNIVVSGGTGSGKTTLLNVLGGFVPETDRIITIEDAAELQLKQEHVISLEARPPNIEGKGAISIRDLVRNSLRMRPDRILVGECRGGEALDMLQAMNTGHDGSLTTVHANSPRDTISRLETLVLMSGMDLPVRAIREQIASAVDLIVQESRFSDGSRKVTNITEVVGLEGDRTTMQDIFVYEQKGVDAEGRVVGRFAPTGSVPTFLDSLRARGVKLDQTMFDPQR